MGFHRAAWWGAAAALAAVGAVLVLAGVGFAECMAENRTPARDLSWPWSPRRKFCDQSSAEWAGVLPLLLVPALVILIAGLLRSKGHRTISWAVAALAIPAAGLPALYVETLPSYRLDSYPVLHQPLLRTAGEGGAPRVCYLYGIAHGRRRIEPKPDTRRSCIELEPTTEGRTLTPAYDEGRTSYDLDLVGHKLTERGLPIESGPTGVDGLAVTRTYSLRDAEARRGAHSLD